MNKLFLSAIVSGAILLSGCSAMNSVQEQFAYKRGTNVTQVQIDEFKTAKTNRADIIKLLGEPQKQDDKSVEYHYQQINHLSGGVDQTIVFVFDKNNVLADVKKIAGSNFGNALTGS